MVPAGALASIATCITSATIWSGASTVIGPTMTLCVESFIGAAGESEGVKLEEQILMTETGTELLPNYKFEASLLA